MPIAGSRILSQGGGIASPNIDLSGCVLYVPFWRPDMVARGGSIVNGTGTMDVSPQALAVGANTITVTAAGTFVVNMPEGGTVASGTMTVSGSPVTVSAGIATTITTTGATGNITCTPSNIIRSKDGSNTAITIVGPAWTSTGRLFTTTQTITFPNVAALKPNAFTCIMRFSLTSLGSRETFGWANGNVPTVGGQWSSDTRILLYMGGSNLRYFDTAGTAYPTVPNKFTTIAITCPGNAQADITSATAYVNGLLLAAGSTTSSGAQTAKGQPQIGDTAGSWDFLGTYSDLLLYNSILDISKIRRITQSLMRW